MVDGKGHRVCAFGKFAGVAGRKKCISFLMLILNAYLC